MVSGGSSLLRGSLTPWLAVSLALLSSYIAAVSVSAMLPVGSRSAAESKPPYSSNVQFSSSGHSGARVIRIPIHAMRWPFDEGNYKTDYTERVKDLYISWQLSCWYRSI